MNRVLIWDLPTRLFHWLLSGGFITAAVISLALGEDSPLFPYHAIIGLTIALMVCLRIIWGLAGTRYARFGTFIFGPAAVIEYMKGTLVGGGKRYIGHNPPPRQFRSRRDNALRRRNRCPQSFRSGPIRARDPRRGLC